MTSQYFAWLTGLAPDGSLRLNSPNAQTIREDFRVNLLAGLAAGVAVAVLEVTSGRGGSGRGGGGAAAGESAVALAAGAPRAPAPCRLRTAVLPA